MKSAVKCIILILSLCLIVACLSTCAKEAGLKASKGLSEPGTSITKNGVKLNLYGNPIKINKKFPEIKLKDAFSNKVVNLLDYKGTVVLLSVVPSVKTPVCIVQTQYLCKKGEHLGDNILRVTISRDSPDELKTFNQKANLTDIVYLSDLEFDSFRNATGLGIEGEDIIARSVIVIDKDGIVRYMQVVPEITALPDLEKAFEIALELDSS